MKVPNTPCRRHCSNEGSTGNAVTLPKKKQPAPEFMSHALHSSGSLSQCLLIPYESFIFCCLALGLVGAIYPPSYASLVRVHSPFFSECTLYLLLSGVSSPGGQSASSINTLTLAPGSLCSWLFLSIVLRITPDGGLLLLGRVRTDRDFSNFLRWKE